MSTNQFHSCASYCDSSADQYNSRAENKHLSAINQEQKNSSNDESTRFSILSNKKSLCVNKQTVSVIGIGESGLSLVSRLANSKFGVIAVDEDSELVNAILRKNMKRIPEEYRQSFFSSRSNKTLSATTDLTTASKCADVIMITPSWNQAPLKTSACIERVLELVNSIGSAIASTTKYQLVAFYDFENFEFLRETLIQTIQTASKKAIGKDLGVCGIIEHSSKHHSYATAYIKGFDPSSEIAIRRVYKKLGAVNTVFDY